MDLHFSIIIPVYNRPDEIDELLESLTKQISATKFDVLIVEDGSSKSSEDCVKKYQNKLTITYFLKENSGPGLSRNFGMQRATGNYFIILDSDCILPKQYLTEVSKALTENFTNVFGGPDAAHNSFTTTQKAINYAMTSMLTTGGIRGKKNTHNKFQPRSFNMGLSKKAFENTNGFGSQRFGEDIDLTFRLWKNGFETQLIEKAFVYHKRRIDFRSFFKQIFNFGAARPILNKQHPGSAKITYWFPSTFIIYFSIAVIAAFFGVVWIQYGLYLYILMIVIDSLIKNKNIAVAIYSVIATMIMFFGYGLGFLRSFFRLHILKKSITDAFPEMFS